MTGAQPPDTSFHWSRYADATLAGLSPLIPIPLLDWAFEAFFRRRMPGDIARARQRRLKPEVVAILNQGNRTCLQTCLSFPLVIAWELVKRTSRKILYFLAIKQATDSLSTYWHQAFLIDTMLLAGHLEDEQTAQVARQAMDQVLDTTTTSPLVHLAARLTAHPRRILRSLFKAQRGKEDSLIQEKRSQIIEQWSSFAGYLEQVAARYQRAYQELADRQAAEAAAQDTLPTGESQ